MNTQNILNLGTTKEWIRWIFFSFSKANASPT